MNRISVPALHGWRRAVCMLCLGLLLLPGLAMAQASRLTAADMADVQSFTLNEDVFARLQQVVREAKAMDFKRGQVDMGKVHSLDDLAQQMVASDSRVQPMLAKHGFTPRQFLVANLAVVSTVVAMQSAHTPEQQQALSEKLNPANVRFYQSHKAAMLALLLAAQKKR